MPPSGEDRSVSNQNLRSARETVDTILHWVSRFAALLVIVVYSPILLLAGLFVAMSPGPTCVSKAYRRANGNIVYLYEFRTECWRTYRETEVGMFLRKTSLYRMPTFVNVLLGQVAVGEALIRIGA